MEYSKEKGRPFLMYNVTPEYFEQLNEWYPERFQIEYDRQLQIMYMNQKSSRTLWKQLHGKVEPIYKFKSLYDGLIQTFVVTNNSSRGTLVFKIASPTASSLP